MEETAMDIDQWLDGVEAIKAYPYTNKGLSDGGKQYKNIKEYLDNLKSGKQSETNIYGKGNPLPAIIIIIGVEGKSDHNGRIAGLYKITSKDGTVDPTIIYYDHNSPKGFTEAEINKRTGFALRQGQGNTIFKRKDPKTGADFKALLGAIRDLLLKEQGQIIESNSEQRQKTESRQIILYGPPGTGKTREAKIRAAEIAGVADADGEIAKPNGRIKLVQFHPSYSYFDFVEGIEAGENGFKFKDKVFKEFAKRAEDDPGNKYVLIIDEINRANIASVFGELLYALEYRGKTISTGGGTLVVPENLYIMGTMNTADVSIAGIDYAVRRRFGFIRVNSRMPDGTFEEYDDEGKPIKHKVSNGLIDGEHDLSKLGYDGLNFGNYKVGEKWFISNLYNRIRIDLQHSLARGVDIEDIMPGVSYFLVNSAKNENGEEIIDSGHLQYKINYELIPLLGEYARNGLLSKRYKLDNKGSLYEMLVNANYSVWLNEWLKTKEDERNEGKGDAN